MILALLLACAVPETKDGPATAEDEVELPVATGPSLYALDVPLVNHRGEDIRLDQFRGSPVIVSMFYTECPMACPLLVEAATSALAEAGNPAVPVLFVSIDPANDTVEAMKKSHDSRGVGEQFTFAAPPADRVREIAALLGIKYRPLPAGGFAHTSVLVLLDGEGREVARAEGAEGRGGFVAALRGGR